MLGNAADPRFQPIPRDGVWAVGSQIFCGYFLWDILLVFRDFFNGKNGIRLVHIRFKISFPSALCLGARADPLGATS